MDKETNFVIYLLHKEKDKEDKIAFYKVSKRIIIIKMVEISFKVSTFVFTLKTPKRKGFITRFKSGDHDFDQMLTATGFF